MKNEQIIDEILSKCEKEALEEELKTLQSSIENLIIVANDLKELLDKIKSEL